MVATSALGSCAYGLLQRSPVEPGTTLLNADLALLFVPAMLFGVSIGARPWPRPASLRRHPAAPYSSVDAGRVHSAVPHWLACAAGVVLNPISPEWLQSLLLTVLLLVVVRKTFEKGIKQWREEQKSHARW